MKKSKLVVGLMTAFLSAGVLAGCGSEVKFSSDGLILTYTDGQGKAHEIKGDEFMKEYYSDSSKYQSIFDSIYSIVVRNYFTFDEEVTYGGIKQKIGKSQMGQIEIDANFKVDTDKRTAQKNADTNDTSYSDEFNAILSSKGVKDEEELLQYYIEEQQRQTFDENFYKYHVDELKNGADDILNADSSKFWTGYFKDMVPYHVSHILVKLEDSSGTNYANGTISKENAENLYNVVNTLGKGDYSFGKIAERFSEDDGSAANYGDLGIMDYSTGYVNEFKLGIYAYENLISNKAEEATKSKIAFPKENAEDTHIEDELKNIVKDSFDDEEIPTIPASIFTELKEYANITKSGVNSTGKPDASGKAVIDDATLVYPRNIIYNKYLNRHSFAFVTNNETSDVGFGKGDTGYHVYSSTENTVLNSLGKGVLSVKIGEIYQPILAVRAGSDYQGIHFIVVNRSPFEGSDDKKTVNGVTLDDYYTTYYPEQKGFYPEDSSGPLQTYVNFTSTLTADTKKNAESLSSTIKSFDSDKLNKYIYKRYYKIQNIRLSNEELDKALNKWIDRSLEKKAQEADDAWEKTWNEYLDMLGKQITERSKLVSEACKIGFPYANDEKTLKDVSISFEGATKTLYGAMSTILNREKPVDLTERLAELKDGNAKISDLFKLEGGLCNDGKAHL